MIARSGKIRCLDAVHWATTERCGQSTLLLLDELEKLFCSIRCRLWKVVSDYCLGTSHEAFDVAQSFNGYPCSCSASTTYTVQLGNVRAPVHLQAGDLGSGLREYRRFHAVQISHLRARLLSLVFGLGEGMEGGQGAVEVQPVTDQAPQLNAAAVAFERFGLQNKSCVVTGGTKGIGAAIVYELASLKAKVSDRLCVRCQQS